jgi:effector-binding domain-containing protein
VDLGNIQSFYARNLPSIASKVALGGQEMDGMPCGLYYSWDMVNNKTDMAAAIPVKKPMTIKGFSTVDLPEQKGIQINHYGDYSNISRAHDAIAAYLKDQGLFNEYPVVEEYVTDPGVEEDPSKWLTKITYYLADEN